MQTRPEWIKCIRKPSGTKYESLCGLHDFEFKFEDLVHAELNEKAGGRLVTCSDCLKIAQGEIDVLSKM